MRARGWMAAAVMVVAGVALGEGAGGLRFAVSDKENIRKHQNEVITVYGQVSNVTVSPSGSITFINFKGNARGDFTAVVQKADKAEVDKGFEGDVAKALKGRDVEINGKVQEYLPRGTQAGSGILQIYVTKPDQIKVTAAPATAPTTEKAAETK